MSGAASTGAPASARPALRVPDNPVCKGCWRVAAIAGDGCVRVPGDESYHDPNLPAPTAVPMNAVDCPRACCPMIAEMCKGCVSNPRGCERDGQPCKAGCCEPPKR